jgi:hypothetical protein
MVGIFARVLLVVLALPTSASSVANPLTIGDVTFTSLTGTLSIYNITASGTWSADGTEVVYNTLFPGAEPDSAISNLSSLRLTRY